MKSEATRRAAFDAAMLQLNERLAAARAETKRMSARRAATQHKLAAIGRHLSLLESELAELNATKAPARKPRAT